MLSKQEYKEIYLKELEECFYGKEKKLSKKKASNYYCLYSKQNDKYMKMLCNAMSGSTKEEAEKNYDKIIRNIAREVVIDKSL